MIILSTSQVLQHTNILFDTSKVYNGNSRSGFGIYADYFNGNVDLPPGLDQISALQLPTCTGTINIPDSYTGNNGRECRMFQATGSRLVSPGFINNAINNGYNLFNPSISIPNGLINAGQMFINCITLNRPVPIFASQSNMNNARQMFYNCLNFNQQVNIPHGECDCTYMLAQCKNFNSAVYFPSVYNGQHDFGWMFEGCTNFNGRIFGEIAGSSVRNMFDGCSVFNQPFTVNGNCNMMLSNCGGFNSVVTFGSNCYDGYQMFRNCQNFSQPVTVPNNMYMRAMFADCPNLSALITLPFTANSDYSMSAFYNSSLASVSAPSSLLNEVVSRIGTNNTHSVARYLDWPESVVNNTSWY